MQKYQPGVFKFKEKPKSCMLQVHAQYQEPIQKSQITNLKYLESIEVTWLAKNQTEKTPLIAESKTPKRIHMFSKNI